METDKRENAAPDGQKDAWSEMTQILWSGRWEGLDQRVEKLEVEEKKVMLRGMRNSLSGAVERLRAGWMRW